MMENFFIITCLNKSVKIKFISFGDIIVNLFYKLNNELTLKQYSLDTFILLQLGLSISFINNGEIFNTNLNNYLILKAEGEGKIKISGNLNAINKVPQFTNLFNNCLNLVNTEDLIFDYTSNYPCKCLKMFYNCKCLTKGLKEIKIKKISEYGCEEMFAYCSNLETPPSLPLTNLAEGCYMNMFNSCHYFTNLNNFNLPATLMKKYCYRGMFINCKFLQYGPKLNSTKLARGCYKLMFANCQELLSSPYLPAKKLAYECYAEMFIQCYKLKHIRVGFEQWPIRGIKNWVSDVATIGKFIKYDKLEEIKDKDHIPWSWNIEKALN